MTAKSSDAFRTISEVADDLNVPQHVLRFWEGRFPQIKPLKRAGGRRYYRPEDVELLGRIRDLLYTQGYTIKGVQNVLKEGLPEGADTVPAAVEADAEPVPPESQPDLPESAPEPPDLPPPELSPPEDFPMPGLFSRVEPAVSQTPATAPVAPTAPLMPTTVPLAPPLVQLAAIPAPNAQGLSPAFRAELEAVVDELEQLRFLLRAQD